MIRRNNIVLSGMIFKTFTTFQSYCKKNLLFFARTSSIKNNKSGKWQSFNANVIIVLFSDDETI